MTEGDENDPYGIVPDGFCEEWDADSIPEALRRAEQDPGTTPLEERERCPACRSTRILEKKLDGRMEHRIDRRYKCERCVEHFDEPLVPAVDDPFVWADGDHGLEDPDERRPVLSELDDEQLTELAIRVYRPWEDDGPSYREIATVLPYSRQWVGERVRAWRDGEHRDLVEEPGPTVDAAPGGTTAVADGGTKKSRWAAYGSD